MNEWALLKDGRIMDVITTVGSRSEVMRQYPHFEVKDLYSLPDHVQKAYHRWNKRP